VFYAATTYYQKGTLSESLALTIICLWDLFAIALLCVQIHFPSQVRTDS